MAQKLYFLDVLGLSSSSYKRQLSPEQIKSYSQSITVKVLSKVGLGSGTIVSLQGKTYTVITNLHVVKADMPPYFVQTFDGKIHEASLIRSNKFNRYDISILRFNSTQTYSSAEISPSIFLEEVGSEVFAGGYPHNKGQASITVKDLSNQFHFTYGRISLTLDKSLEDGYQLGFTNDLERGMSGGSLLNSYGELIGINGRNNDPLWEAINLYQDGSVPCPSLQKLIEKSSWAIPIEGIFKIDPQLFPVKDSRLQAASNWDNIDLDFKAYIPFIMRHMKADADIASRCKSK